MLTTRRKHSHGVQNKGCSGQGSYCVNDLWMIDSPVGWAPGGRLFGLAKCSVLCNSRLSVVVHFIFKCIVYGIWGSFYLIILMLYVCVLV